LITISTGLRNNHSVPWELYAKVSASFKKAGSVLLKDNNFIKTVASG